MGLGGLGRRLLLSAWVLLLTLLPAAVWSEQTELLAAMCNACHGAQGQGSDPVPALAGGKAMEARMLAWRGADKDAAPEGAGHQMQRLARGLTEDQIRALASHYADRSEARANQGVRP